MKSTGLKCAERKEAETVSKARKATKPSRTQATAAERAHIGAVAAMGCCLCLHLGFGATPAEVHHVRAWHGWGRSGHMNTIPLCPFHHRGEPGGIHSMGRKQFAAYYGISEMELLEAVSLQIASKPASS